jgi:pimeloyl-ACP methyl ester carboxylesterase
MTADVAGHPPQRSCQRDRYSPNKGYAAEFDRTGFTGALNRYRNLDRDWADLGRLGAATITQPALFVGGERDTATRSVRHKPMEQAVADLRSVVIPGCGHWIQQEQPGAVNGELVTFLRQHTR